MITAKDSLAFDDLLAHLLPAGAGERRKAIN